MQHIAIVGGGPRGLAALEALILKLSNSEYNFNGKITIFEQSKFLGAGEVYSPDQAHTNWLNISQRGLTLPARPEITLNGVYIAEFPSYQTWVNAPNNSTINDPDIFPPRSTLGRYLVERFECIARPLRKVNIVDIIKAKIINIQCNDKDFDITSECKRSWCANEVALTIGHQPTEVSKQWLEWKTVADRSKYIEAIDYPYPVSALNENKTIDRDNGIAIRGFGLAMVDAMRALTIGRGGRFISSTDEPINMVYSKNGHEPKVIMPFSLNGLPMAPKPFNEKVDQQFFPTPQELNNLEHILSKAAKKGTETSKNFVLTEIAKIATRVFNDLPYNAKVSNKPNDNLTKDELHTCIYQWLHDSTFECNLIMSCKLDTYILMENFVKMAFSEAPISLDYCIGQVWRHCQPTLYKALSYSNLDDDVMTEIIEKDEQLKRYSYGPPVQSIQQILALVDADILNLNFNNNPDINITPKGWTLTNGSQSITVAKMVNSVLDTPAVAKINSPIIEHLKSQKLIKLVSSDLGVTTKKNGCIEPVNDHEDIPLAIMGRLAKGTLLGVDAILECFNDRTTYWAEDVIKRLPKLT